MSVVSVSMSAKAPRHSAAIYEQLVEFHARPVPACIDEEINQVLLNDNFTETYEQIVASSPYRRWNSLAVRCYKLSVHMGQVPPANDKLIQEYIDIVDLCCANRCIMAYLFAQDLSWIQSCLDEIRCAIVELYNKRLIDKPTPPWLLRVLISSNPPYKSRFMNLLRSRPLQTGMLRDDNYKSFNDSPLQSNVPVQYPCFMETKFQTFLPGMEEAVEVTVIAELYAIGLENQFYAIRDIIPFQTLFFGNIRETGNLIGRRFGALDDSLKTLNELLGRVSNTSNSSEGGNSDGWLSWRLKNTPIGEVFANPGFGTPNLVPSVPEIPLSQANVIHSVNDWHTLRLWLRFNYIHSYVEEYDSYLTVWQSGFTFMVPGTVVREVPTCFRRVLPGERFTPADIDPLTGVQALDTIEHAPMATITNP
jgi:hypothetical protein